MQLYWTLLDKTCNTKSAHPMSHAKHLKQSMTHTLQITPQLPMCRNNNMMSRSVLVLITFRVSTICPLSHCPKDISSSQNTPNQATFTIRAQLSWTLLDKACNTKSAHRASHAKHLKQSMTHTLQIALQLPTCRNNSMMS